MTLSDGASAIEEARASVAFASRVLGTEGVTRGPVGHVSLRCPGDPTRVLIKARGPEEEGLEFATERDIILIDLEGNSLEAPPGLKPPAETALHTEILLQRSDVSCVVHVHPSWVVALSAAGRDLLPIYGAFDPTGLRLVDAGIPVYESSVTVHSVGEAKAVAECMGEASACVMRQHGVVVAAAGVEEALRITLALNELAKLNWMAAAVGEPRRIPDEDLQIFRERFSASDRRTSSNLVRADGHSPYWHYLERRMDSEAAGKSSDSDALEGLLQ